MAYTKYSLTPADNNAAPPNGAPEGMLPSAVNDTMRDMMSQIRDVGDGIRGGTYTMTAPVITGGSITGVALSGNTFTSPVITGGSINNTPIGATTANTGKFTTLTNAALTSGRVTYAGTSGVLQDDADFTFNGTTVTMANDASISGLTVGKGGGAVGSNTAVGASALANGSNTGAGVSAFGSLALQGNTTGDHNNAFGRAVLQTNTTGAYNSAFGSGSQSALQLNTTGSNNSAFGSGALFSNTTASNNTAVGYQALYMNSTGAECTAIGGGALFANTGNNNTAIGRVALLSNTTGVENFAGARQTLYSNTTGSYNCAVGASDGVYGSSMLYNTTGSYNTAFGNGALASLTVSNQHSCFGFQAGANITNGTGGTYVGYKATASGVSADYEMVISTRTAGATGKGSSTGFIDPNGGAMYNGGNTTTWTTTSDQRLKKNIVDNNDGLNKLADIRVRNFEYRLPEEVTDLPQDQAIQKTGVQLGVIAQELQAVLPDCVKAESTGVLSVQTDNLIWYAINAIKELKAEVDSLKQQLNGA